MAVAHIGPGDAPVPAQVVHPLQPRDLVERGPGVFAPLGLEPRSEGERRHAQRRTRQLLGRAQCFHARRGGPGPLVVFRRAVQQHRRDALLRERHAGRQACLAGADDEHVDDRPARMHALRQPGLRAPVEGQQVVLQPLFKSGQPGRAQGRGNSHEKIVAVADAGSAMGCDGNAGPASSWRLKPARPKASHPRGTGSARPLGVPPSPRRAAPREGGAAQAAQGG